MPSSSTTTAVTAPNPTSTAANNPAVPASKPTTDAPSYTSDVSPPAYSEAVPTYDLAAPSTSSSAPTNPASNDDAPASDDEQDLPATPIPFHFLIQQQPTPTTDPSTAHAEPQPRPAPPKKITHTHPVPDILLGAAPPASAQDLFVQVLQDVLGAHQDECRDAAPAACDVCGRAKESVLLTPVSFLHVEDGRRPPPYEDAAGTQGAAAAGEKEEEETGKRVDVLVTPVCGDAACGEMARKRLRCAMEDTHNDDHDQERVRVVPPAGPEDPRCRVCGRVEGTRRCAGCGVVRYCGRECQRRDWKAGGHKRVCEVWAALVEEGRVEEAKAMAATAAGGGKGAKG